MRTTWCSPPRRSRRCDEGARRQRPRHGAAHHVLALPARTARLDARDAARPADAGGQAPRGAPSPLRMNLPPPPRCPCGGEIVVSVIQAWDRRARGERLVVRRHGQERSVVVGSHTMVTITAEAWVEIAAALVLTLVEALPPPEMAA